MWNWDSRTHQFILSKALKKCYQPFQNMLEAQQEIFVLGIEAPDRIFKDFTNHYYNCTPNSTGYHYGSVIKKINSEIELIEAMLANPDKITLHPRIAPFLKSLLDTPLKAFTFELGVISHYIADLHQPFHTDGKEKFAEEEVVHKILEADTRLHLDDFQIKLPRRKRIKNPVKYFMDQVYFINEYYDNLVENYYLRKNKVKADRWENSFSTIQFCLQQAAYNISNVYLNWEKRSRIFATQIKQMKLQQKIKKLTRFDGNYRLRKYSSGSFLVKRLKQ